VEVITEVISVAATVHSTPVTTLVPESAAEVRCAVYSWPPFVVAVIRGEYLTDVDAERISAGVT